MLDMETPHRPSKRIKTLDNSFDIIEYLMANDGATLDEVSEAQDLSTSTIHSYLSTLVKRGYLRKSGSEYHVGVLFLNLGSYARNSRTNAEVIRSGLQHLATETNERAQFAIEEYGKAFILYRERGDQAIRTGHRIGSPMFLHNHAAGKAILANLPDERINEILDHWGLVETTDKTLTDREELFNELREIEERSLAFNRGESRSNLWAIASPVKADGTVVGAVSVAGPAQRIQRQSESDLTDTLLSVVNEIELNTSTDDWTP